MNQLLLTDPTWHTAEAGTIAGVLAMRGVSNPDQHPAINQLAAELETELRDRFAGQDRAAIQATPPFPAYAAYYKRFGQRYHVGMQLESVALKGKSLPRVAGGGHVHCRAAPRHPHRRPRPGRAHAARCARGGDWR